MIRMSSAPAALPPRGARVRTIFLQPSIHSLSELGPNSAAFTQSHCRNLEVSMASLRRLRFDSRASAPLQTSACVAAPHMIAAYSSCLRLRVRSMVLTSARLGFNPSPSAMLFQVRPSTMPRQASVFTPTSQSESSLALGRPLLFPLGRALERKATALLSAASSVLLADL